MANHDPVPLPPYRLVLVVWEDHSGNDDGWIPLSLAKADMPMVITSAGWLVSESKERIVIFPHIGVPNERKPEMDGCGEMTIARALIHELREICIAKPVKRKAR